MVKPEISGDFSKLMSWADKIRKLKVRTNSETPLDTKTAKILVQKGLVFVELNICFLMKKEYCQERNDFIKKSRG